MMKRILHGPVKVFLAMLLATNIILLVLLMKSKGREDIQSQTYQDCSVQRSDNKPEKSPFWKESDNFMNLTHRAERGIEIFLRHKQPHGLIVDIGSGFQKLREQVPRTMSYRSVDLVQRVEGAPTSICNLNRLQFPFFMGEHVSAYFFLGSFEYILDKVSVLRLCRKRNAAVVMQYKVGVFGEGKSFQWVTPLTMEAMRETADIAGYNLHVYDNLRDSDGKKDENKFFYFEPM